jgi:NAD(P)-dependent dehydrogenase (short-subunit alcohol dehydrogenase family)
MAESTDLAGRVALVTGGASGIGRATALLLAARGARVVVADLDAEQGSGVVAEIAGAGGEAAFVTTDVTDPVQVQAMVDAAVGRWGGLHIAVNNAGTSGTYAKLADQPLEDWNRTLAINLTATFLCVQAEVAALRDAGGGSIVNVASAAGLIGFANLPAYVASKHGVVGLTKSVALEVARKGIRVNVVCPGTVRTPMLRGFAGSDEAIDAMAAPSPIGRAAEPDEIADAIVWLCSDASTYVTGTALSVDGGVLAT